MTTISIMHNALIFLYYIPPKWCMFPHESLFQSTVSTCAMTTLRCARGLTLLNGTAIAAQAYGTFKSLNWTYAVETSVNLLPCPAPVPVAVPIVTQVPISAGAYTGLQYSTESTGITLLVWSLHIASFTQSKG